MLLARSNEVYWNNQRANVEGGDRATDGAESAIEGTTVRGAWVTSMQSLYPESVLASSCTNPDCREYQLQLFCEQRVSDALRTRLNNAELLLADRINGTERNEGNQDASLARYSEKLCLLNRRAYEHVAS